MDIHRLFRTSVFAWLAFILVGCTILRPEPEQTTGTPTQAVVPATIQEATATTPIPTPTLEPTHTPTYSPSPTPPPTATVTPTAEYWAAAGTALPDLLPVISPVNADALSGLAAWQVQTATSLIWLPGGREIAVSTGDTIIIFDALTQQVLYNLQPGAQGIFDLAVNRSNNLLLAASLRGDEIEGFASALEIWRLPNFQPRGILYGTPRRMSGITISQDDELMLVGYTTPEIEGKGELDFWRTRTLVITATLQTGPVLQMAFSPNGKKFVTTPDRYALRVWDINTLLPVLRLHTSFTGAVSSFAFGPNSQVLASGHYDGAIRLWDVNTGRVLWEVMTEGAVTSLDFSPDGSLVATGTTYSPPQVQIWAANSGQLLRSLRGHNQGIDLAHFSPDGSRLLTGSYDGSLRLWGIRP